MKVLFLHTFYKEAGGEDAVVKNEIELLRSNGHEVHLLSFSNDRFTLLKFLLLPFNIFSYLKTRKAIRNIKPDLIHLHNTHFAASLSVVYAASSKKTPIVMTLHNYRMICPTGSLYHDGRIFLDSLTSGFPWSAVKKGVYRNSSILTYWLALSNHLHLKLKTYKKINSFIVLGKHSIDLFAKTTFKTCIEQFTIKPNFSWPKNNTTNTEAQYFLFIGRLTQEKGINTLLAAFSKCDFQLKIAGSGPLSDQVILAAKNHKNIIYLGHQNTNQIDGLFNHALALIFPSEWFETFGMVLIEAFSKSTPVIASALGNIKSIVKDNENGVTFTPRDPDDLLDKIKFYSSLSPEKKLGYRERAKAAYIRSYAPESGYESIIKIYSAAINTHSYLP